MEEKLNSIIIAIVYISGLIFIMDVTEKIYIAMFLALLIFLVFKCRLLILFEDKFSLTLILIIIIFTLGIFRGYLFEEDYKETIGFSGIFSGEAEVLKIESMEKYVIKLNKRPYCKVMLKTKEQLSPGMIIKIGGNLTIPDNEANREGFSYRSYLKYMGIKYILNADQITIINRKMNWRFYLFEYQNFYINQLKRHLGERIRYVESIFLGNVDSLKEIDISTWRNMGILHLQAVSGSQVGAALDILLFLFVITPRKGFCKYMIFIIPLILYGMITATPSVWRVIIYLILIKIFQIFKIEKYEMLALMLSSLILININPGVIFQISFQLSYVISTGLLLFSSKINDIKKPVLKILFSGLFSVILSWPILMEYFQEVPLMSIFFTPLISPLIQIIIFISGILLLVPFLINMLRPLTALLNILLILLDKITNFFSQINLPIFTGRPWGMHFMLLFYLLIVFWDNLSFKERFRKLLITILLILFLGNIAFETFDNKKVIITFINVGQGDSILIECNEVGKVILIDGGAKNESLDMGKASVIPYLKRMGIRKIDILISTHSDNDHRGGLETILKKIEVMNIWIPANQEKEYEDWLFMYKDKIKEINKGMCLKLGEVALNILNPDRRNKDDDANSSSVVISLEYGNSSILLTGDCDLEVLDELVKTRKSFDIVKAPHHGSANSYRENIYNDLNAKSVIFSVGRNRYGHPSKVILRELEDDGIDYYRTDKDKNIVVTMKGYWLDINGRKLEE